MMAGTTVAGNALAMIGFEPSLGHTPWNSEMERDLRVLDAALFGGQVQGFGLPFTPTRLSVWVDEAQRLALWNGVAWETYPPQVGWEIYVVSTLKKYRFNGTTWVELDAAAGGAIVFTQAAPSAAWGPMTHTFGRLADVCLKDSSGRTVYGDVQESTTGQVYAYFAAPTTGQAILS